MVKFLKSYGSLFILFANIIISVLGMIRVKDRIEYNRGSPHENELLFLLFQGLFFGCLIYFVADWGFKKWKEYRILKNEKMNAELINLKNQISPHFFFNTLNNLYGLIKKDSNRAQDFVLKLSELMRYSIYSSDREKVNLREELAYLKNFIALHQIRHYKNVDFRFVEEVEHENISVYPLLFIILVENAIKHGVEKLVDHAYVHCKVESDGQKLRFTVVNNYDNLDEVNMEGLGLKNLRKRLDLLYSKTHLFKTHQENGVFSAFVEFAI